MRHFLPVFTIIFFVTSISLIVVVLTQAEKLSRNKNTFFNLLSQNIKLSSEVNNYKDQAKNMKQIIVSSNTTQSKNQQVAAIISHYTNIPSGTISLYYKNLTTNESVIVDGDRNYYMASLYKVIIAEYVLEAARIGKLSLNDVIGSPAITINNALKLIITESNNEYAQAIAEKYGWKNIESFIKAQFGIDFSFNTNLLGNVKNIGMLFEYIAQSVKISDAESTYILQLLHQQERTTKLPKYLPKNIYSHNKTGEFEDYSHDAAIFYSPKANYVLVFMSKTGDPAKTNEQMALMSKEIYDVLNAL